MCLILNYTYILYICLYPSYTHIDQCRCVTRKFYTLIFILLFFFGKKKIIKWFLLNKWCLFQWEEEGHRWGLSIPMLPLCQGGGWFSPNLTPAVGMLLGHPCPQVPQAFGLRMTWPWVAPVCSWLAFLGKGRADPVTPHQGDHSVHGYSLFPSSEGIQSPFPITGRDLVSLPQPWGDLVTLPHHWQGSVLPSPAPVGIRSPFPITSRDPLSLLQPQGDLLSMVPGLPTLRLEGRDGGGCG